MTEFTRPPEDLEGGASAPAEPPGGRRGPLSLLWAFFRWLISRFGLLALLAGGICGLIYLAARGDGFVRRGELERERASLEAEIEELRDENHLLRERLERLKNDPAFVEDEARKKLGLIRSGETVYRLSEEPDLADDFREPPLP